MFKERRGIPPSEDLVVGDFVQYDEFSNAYHTHFIPDFYQITVQIADSCDQEQQQSNILTSRLHTLPDRRRLLHEQHGFGC
ncbi:hypothetical protein VTN00DRAFT_8975 [Thermoascus crustaceus]|uniref:uncharacterized protein n=1 Tax=Thermoascus crustaceus TaxID=5088 RepID=UPI0037441466